MTDLERALADIAEVRDRLAGAQRFKGYSGAAAIASGVFALSAGFVQSALIGTPHDVQSGREYFAIWLICCALSMAINYAAIAHWFATDADARGRWQTRTVGLTILPALALGGAISFALLRFEAVALLPGVWYAAYGVGLLASRLMLPRAVVPVACAFVAVGSLLLFAPAGISLSPWTLGLGFGAGQIAIGSFVRKERV